MKQKTAGILLLSGVALYYLVLQGIRGIGVSFKGLRVVSIVDDSVRFSVQLYIRNPLLLSVLVNDIVGTIYIMNIPVADVDFPLNQRIHSRSISPVTINFNVSKSKLGEALFANIETGDVRTLLVRFAGYLKISKVKVNVDKQFTFEDIIG